MAAVLDSEHFYRALREPDFLPGYEILTRLGGGGYGVVYKARKRSIRKAYAVKFYLLEDDADPAVVERELARVKELADIDHPNLVRIEDAGVTRGVAFVVMAFAGDTTLHQRIKEPLTPTEALALYVQVCWGVQALHRRRVAHFDIKPSNVLIQGRRARLGDYGFTRPLRALRDHLSVGGGSPGYMAPEILHGRGGLGSDIFSLGVMLFELLAARQPFQSDIEERGTLSRSLESGERLDFPADFPEPLRPLVVRCLQRDPQMRYRSVEELIDALVQSVRHDDPWLLESLNFATEAALERTSIRPGAGARAIGREVTTAVGRRRPVALGVSAPARVLLVEDNPGDVRLVREALTHSDLQIDLEVAADGNEGLQRLRSAAAPPHLVLLDLNMPSMNGREMLERLRSDERLKRIPVVVFTSSSSAQDVSDAYASGANCYITKSSALEEFMGSVRVIVSSWLTLAQLPQES